MTEAELQENVVKMAHLLGWKVAHFRPAQNARGDWRTPVAADGKGFPDLVLASQGRVLFIECKSDIGKLSDEQYHWSSVLGKSLFAVVRPRDWHSGRAERMLRSGQIEE